MLGDIIIKIKADVSQLESALAKARSQVSDTKKHLEKIGKSMKKAGMIITAGAGAVAAGLGLALKTTMSFEEAMANVRKTTGLSKDALKSLERGIRSLAETIPLAQEELANIAAVAGQLGIEGKENILSFTKTVAEAAVAFDMSAEEAATALAKLANIYNIPITQIDRLASAINALGNTTAASENEIIRAMYQIGAAGAQLGATQQQIAAMTATLISMGMAPERAGTRLQSAFNQMASNLDKIAEDMGISVDEVKQMFSEDFYGTLMRYVDLLAKKYPNKLEFLTRANKVFGEVGAKAILSLAQAQGKLNQNLDTAMKAYAKNISLQKEFESRTDTLASKLKVLKNMFADIAIDVGETLEPAIKDLISQVKDMLPELRKFAMAFTNQLIPAMKEVGMAILPIIRWFNNLSPGIKAIIARVAALATVFAMVAGPVMLIAGTALPMLGSALAALMNPIGLVIAGLGMIAAFSLRDVFTGLSKEKPELGLDGAFAKSRLKAREELEKLKDDVKEIFGNIQEIVSTIADIIKSALKDLFGFKDKEGRKRILVFVDAIKSATKAVADFFKKNKDLIKELVKFAIVFGPTVYALLKLVTLTRSVAAGFTAMRMAIFALSSSEGIISALGMAISALGGPITLVIIAVSALAAAWATNFLGIRDKTMALLNFLKSKLDALANLANSAWSWGSNLIANFVSGLESGSDWLARLLDQIKMSIRGLNALKDEAIKWGKNILWKFVSGLKSVFTNMLKVELSIIKDAITNALDLASKAYNWGRNLISSLTSGIKSGLSSLVNTLSSVAGTIESYLGIHSDAKRGPLSDLTKWGGNLVKTLAEGMSNSLNHIIKISKEIGSEIGYNIKSIELKPGLTLSGLEELDTLKENIEKVFNDIKERALEATDTLTSALSNLPVAKISLKPIIGKIPSLSAILNLKPKIPSLSPLRTLLNLIPVMKEIKLKLPKLPELETKLNLILTKLPKIPEAKIKLTPEFKSIAIPVSRTERAVTYKNYHIYPKIEINAVVRSEIDIDNIANAVNKMLGNELRGIL